MDTVIINKGDKYYFTSSDNVYELNERTVSRLQLKLTLPAKVYFRDCSFSFIRNLVSSLFEEPVDLNVINIPNTNNYEATLTRIKEIKLR